MIKVTYKDSKGYSLCEYIYFDTNKIILHLVNEDINWFIFVDDIAKVEKQVSSMNTTEILKFAEDKYGDKLLSVYLYEKGIVISYKTKVKCGLEITNEEIKSTEYVDVTDILKGELENVR